MLSSVAALQLETFHAKIIPWYVDIIKNWYFQTNVNYDWTVLEKRLKSNNVAYFQNVFNFNYVPHRAPYFTQQKNIQIKNIHLRYVQRRWGSNMKSIPIRIPSSPLFYKA